MKKSITNVLGLVCGVLLLGAVAAPVLGTIAILASILPYVFGFAFLVWIFLMIFNPKAIASADEAGSCAKPSLSAAYLRQTLGAIWNLSLLVGMFVIPFWLVRYGIPVPLGFIISFALLYLLPMVKLNGQGGKA